MDQIAIASGYFDRRTFRHRLRRLRTAPSNQEFARLCHPIVLDVLRREGFRRIVQGPNFQGTPFDYFARRQGKPYIIEFKGSTSRFRTPHETQRRRLWRVIRHLPGLGIALLQLKLHTAEYRILFNSEVRALFRWSEAPINPIVEWLRARVR